MRKGFTLIELMVVVAIIAFLASIAIPRYFNYFVKAKQAEVAMILASLHPAELSYYAEHGTYSTNLNEIGFKPENNNYTYGFFFPGAKQGVNYFKGKQECSPASLSECFADRTRFLAKAACDITGKNELDTWSIDENRKLSHN